MKDVGADLVDAASMPDVRRECIQPAEIFMISIHEQGCEGPLFQPVQPVVFLRCVSPYPSEIARHYYVVIPIHSFLLWEVPAAEPPEVSVAIACYKYHVSNPPYMFCSISKPPRKVTRILSLDRTVTFSSS